MTATPAAPLPTDLDLAVADLAVARTSVDTLRRRERAAVDQAADANYDALAAASVGLALVEAALATLTGVEDPADLPDLPDADPAVVTWRGLPVAARTDRSLLGGGRRG